jgi:hypothetical protein
LVGTTLIRTESLIKPISNSPSQFLQKLIETYRKKLSGFKRIGVLVSAGWDSRLELACVAHAINHNQQEITLIHLCRDPADLNMVQSIADLMRHRLIVYNREALIKDFQTRGEFSHLRGRLGELSTWRPSIPEYHVAGRRFMEEGGDVVVGFAPHSLKGRQYDLDLSDEVPSSGLFRAIELESVDVNTANYSKLLQNRTWSNIRGVCHGWDEFAQRDYLLWALHNGYSYSHRCWPDINPGIITINNDPEIVSGFMGLEPEVKRGTAFIRYALTELQPKLLAVQIRSSTGEEGNLEAPRRYLRLSSIDIGYSLILSHITRHSENESGKLPKGDLLSAVQLSTWLGALES